MRLKDPAKQNRYHTFKYNANKYYSNNLFLRPNYLSNQQLPTQEKSNKTLV